MNRVRLATQEECDRIAPTADLDSTCIVIALDTPQGPFLGVVRTAIEVDPVIYPEGAQDKFKFLFKHDIETFLLAKGVEKYYFNIHASNEPAIKVAEGNYGARRLSTAPEYRFCVKMN